MLSEKIYWIILIVGLIVFVSLIGLVLIPCRILDYNLGINLISESIGILFTIVFLTWLFNLREKNQWKVVENEVYSDIQMEIASLFNAILDYVEGGLKLKVTALGKQDKETRKKSLIVLQELKDTEKMKLNDVLLYTLLENRNSTEIFSEIARRLSDIERKYSKFLSAEITLSLMRLQIAIQGLNGVLTLYSKYSKSKLIRKTLPKKLEAEIMKIDYAELVGFSFKRLIEEIHKLHRIGIEFTYP